MKPDLTGYVGSEKSHFFFRQSKKSAQEPLIQFFSQWRLIYFGGEVLRWAGIAFRILCSFQPKREARKKIETIGGKKIKRGEKHRDISNWEHRKSNN